MRTIRRRVTSEPTTVRESMKITQMCSGPRRGAWRSGPRPAARRMSLAAGLTLALAATGCLRDGTGPATGVARLAVTATVAGAGAAPVTGLAVRAVYARSAGDPGVLLEQQVPLAEVAPGATVRQPLTLDLAPCLSDPQHLPGAGTCRVLVRVTLLAGSAALDAVTIGPLDLRPGESATPSEVTLHTVGTLAVTPAAPAPILPGQTLQLTGTFTDITGGVVSGREIAWSSSALAVATVDATGNVTAVAPGTATITASGGDRTATVIVSVAPRASIQLDRPAVSFTAAHTGTVPASQDVLVVNGASGPLDRLAVGTIAYDGDVAPWLTATLSGGAAPATLRLRPSRTDLAPGSYTATVPLTAPGAQNSGVTVRVSYTVTSGTLIVLDQSLIQVDSSMLWDDITVGVSAAAPLAGLVTDVRFGPYASGWLTARLTSGTAPSDLILNVSGTLFPGFYQADVRVTSPGAANTALLQVVRTVPPDGYYFYLTGPGCVYVGDPDYAPDSLYLSTSLYDTYGPMGGAPVTLEALGPGLTLLSETSTTFGSAMATRTPGFVGTVQVVATLGLAPHSPGSLTDTLSVVFDDSDPYCGDYAERRAPYEPGTSAPRRATTAPPAPATSGPAAAATPPRVRRAPTAAAPAAHPARSRFTPGYP